MSSEIIQLPHDKSWITQWGEIPGSILCDGKTFNELWNLKPENRGSIKMYGKEIEIPRWQLNLGQDYSFTGKLHKSQGPINIHPYLVKLQEWVNKDSGLQYQQCLINFYTNGTEYIGPHSDDETQLVHSVPIYSFSFGSPRDFVVQGKESDYRLVIPMHDNSCLVMNGEMQKHFKHSVPKRLKVKNPRINVTFRLFKTD